jgi:putative ABC transport system permease protein
MIKNYFLTTLRFLRQNKLFACINMVGLSVALAASFILLLYVINELSYDHCHKNRKSVFRLLSYYPELKSTGDPSPYILGTTFKGKFPQIEKVCRILPLTLNFKSDNGLIKETAISTDSDVFNIFTISLIEGSAKNNLLEDKSSIVISLDLSKKLFGSQNAVGKKIVAGAFDGDHTLTVSGVFANIPENSTFKAQCIINSRWSVDYINKRYYVTNAETSWDQGFWTTWILLSEKSDAQSLVKQINTYIAKKASGHPAVIYSLQNLSNVYLGSVGLEKHGDINSIRIFSALAFLITVVAALNYIILSVAISTGRRKEIAIRKTFGAGTEKIRGQFLSESLTLVSTSLPLAILLMLVFMPIAGNLLNTQLHIMKSNIFTYLISYLVLVILIGIVSGFYTSMYLSKLSVLDIINNVFHAGKSKFSYRSLLILLQLMIFCSFMSAALLIHLQYMYLINKDMGFYTKNILLLDLGDGFNNASSYLNSINANPNVISAAGTSTTIPITDVYATMETPNPENSEIQVPVNIIAIDINFIRTMGLTIVKGRDFSEEFGSDNYKAQMLNETAVKQLGLTDPVGKIVGGDIVIGVVKDFNAFSLYNEISPMAMIIGKEYRETIAVHYKDGTLGNILPIFKEEWQKVAPGRTFKYTTIESIIENLYVSEKNLGIVVTIFSFLTLLIAAFGLFGLTLFISRSKSKEIGIRKVFGSSENSIIFYSINQYLILAVIGSMLAIPIATYFISQWLKHFAFKISINWWVFLFTFICASIVVLLTVLYHSIKISRVNPVEALKQV